MKDIPFNYSKLKCKTVLYYKKPLTQTTNRIERKYGNASTKLAIKIKQIRKKDLMM